MMNGNWTDDRPIKVSNVDTMMEEFNVKVAGVIAKYPNAVKPYTELNKDEERK